MAEGRLVVPFDTALASTEAFYLVSPEGLRDNHAARMFRAWLLSEAGVLTIDAVAVYTPGYAKSVRHVSGKIKAAVYREYALHALVCGKMSLPEAQKAMAHDWISADKRWVGD